MTELDELKIMSDILNDFAKKEDVVPVALVAQIANTHLFLNRDGWIRKLTVSHERLRHEKTLLEITLQQDNQRLNAMQQGVGGIAMRIERLIYGEFTADNLIPRKPHEALVRIYDDLKALLAPEPGSEIPETEIPY